MRLPPDPTVRTVMSTKLHHVALMIAGSFLIYCCQAAHPDGGAVPDASAGGTCCTPVAQTFTKLAEGTVAASSTSPVISVAGSAELVVYYRVTPGCNVISSIGPQVYFRPDGSTAFGYTGQAAAGRVRVDGPDMQIGAAGCDITYAVATVQ